MTFRRLRAMAALVAAVDRADDEHLEHAIAAARRAAAPESEIAPGTPAEVLAAFGAAVAAHVPVVVRIDVAGGAAGPFQLEMVYRDRELLIGVEHYGWHRHIAYLRQAMGRRGTPVGTAEADAIRTILETLTARGDEATLVDVTASALN